MKIGDKVFAYDEKQGVKVGYLVGDIFKVGFQVVVSIDQKIINNVNESNFDRFRSVLFFANPSRIFPYKNKKYKKYRRTVSFFNKNYKLFTYKSDYFQFNNTIYDNQYKWGLSGLAFELCLHYSSYFIGIFFQTLFGLLFLPITIFINYFKLNIDSNRIIGELRTQRNYLVKKSAFSLPKEEIEATRKNIELLEQEEHSINTEKKELKNIFIAILLPILAALIPLYVANNNAKQQPSNDVVKIEVVDLNNRLEEISQKIDHFDRNIDFHIHKFINEE